MPGSAHTFVRANVAGSAPEWVAPSSWTTWLASHTYTVGAFVVPPTANGWYYEATTVTGPTGSTPPAFPTPTGTTVTDGDVIWTCRYTTAVLVAEMETMDAQLQGLINAADGQSCGPTNPIVIGGQGLTVLAGSPTQVCRGGSLQLTGTGGIDFNDDDWPNYIPGIGANAGPHPGSTRIICYSCAEGLGHPTFMWRPRWSDGGMQAVAGLIDYSDGTGQHAAILRVPLRCHDGATLSTATVYFRIGFAHGSVPSQLPMARIVRVDAGGNVVPMTSKAAGGDPNGFVTATAPASAANWTGNQQIAIACDQNNVVSLAEYTYYAEIIEEQIDGGYPWSLVCLEPVKALLVVTSPATQLLNGGTVDGVTVAAGDRVLVIFTGGAAAFAFRSGIYVVNTSATGWTRAPDFAQASDFSQGLFVRVQQGANFAGATLQIASTLGSWSPGDNPPLPGAAQPWNSSIVYSGFGANSWSYVPVAVLPTTPNGYWYQSGSTGFIDAVRVIPGATEPVWPTVVGQTVVDSNSWVASTYYAMNTLIVAAGYLFQANTSGTTSTGSVAWPTSVQGTVVDGGVTWENKGSPPTLTCMGKTADALTFVGRPDPDHEVSGLAGSAFFCHGNAYDCVQVTFTGITSGSFQ